MFTGIKQNKIFLMVDIYIYIYIVLLNNKFEGGKVETINIKKILNKSQQKKVWGPQLIKNIFIKLVENMQTLETIKNIKMLK